MFEILFLIFSWLPAPLNILAFGAVCILALFALIKLIAVILDLLPFF